MTHARRANTDSGFAVARMFKKGAFVSHKLLPSILLACALLAPPALAQTPKDAPRPAISAPPTAAASAAASSPRNATATAPSRP